MHLKWYAIRHKTQEEEEEDEEEKEEEVLSCSFNSPESEHLNCILKYVMSSILSQKNDLSFWSNIFRSCLRKNYQVRGYISDNVDMNCFNLRRALVGCLVRCLVNQLHFCLRKCSVYLASWATLNHLTCVFHAWQWYLTCLTFVCYFFLTLVQTI